jgi:hypothetical protein
MLTKPRLTDASQFECLNVDPDEAGFFHATLEALTTVNKSLRYKQIFMTRQGKLGFSLKGVLVGDQLCIFDGAPTAHVTRKADDADQGTTAMWRFHGPAYVGGMINGGIEDMGLESHDIVIV